MIRLFHVYFPGRTLLLVLSEMLVVLFALIPAAFAVFGESATEMLIYRDELLRLVLVICVCMVCMHYYDLYDSMILDSPIRAATKVVQVLGSSCIILACVYYVYPTVEVNQTLLILWVGLAGISLIGWRRVFLALNRSARLKQKTLLIGSGPLAASLASEIESRPELGIRLAGYAGRETSGDNELGRLPHIGGLDRMRDVLHRYQIQRVIIATRDRRDHLPVKALLAAKARGTVVDDGARLYEAIAGRIDLSSLRPRALLFSEGFRLSALMAAYKRAASLIFSALGIAITLPLMGLIALAIRLDSRGPVIFRQRRIGRDGKPFTLYKFRSMHDGADKQGPLPAQENDSRCTRIGKRLRRARLDELPQLFNILRGDMHFIGPRPFAVEMERELAKQIPFYSNRWTVRPGATGWAQVRRGYNETLEDNIEKLSYDLYYIKNLSAGLDFVILLETIKILLLGRGAR